MGWQGGTLFLQEPQALPLDLQRGLVERMQAESSSTTLRVAAGMRLEPAEAIRKGLLLPELAHLLETLVVRLPALRDRRDDLGELLDLFWKRARSCAQTRRCRTGAKREICYLTTTGLPTCTNCKAF